MMWIFLSGGFLSIVAHRHKPNHFLLRARNMDHLKQAFPNAGSYKYTDSDYPHRADIEKNEVSDTIADYVMNISYDNFKNSISEQRYEHACHDIWDIMFRYGFPYRKER